RPIPVAEGNYSDIANALTQPTKANVSGETASIKGSELMDNFLRQSFGYQGQDQKDGPIFSYLSYMHPEKSKVKLDFSELGDSSNLKGENGITHMGAYIGNGHTRNSPYNYHSMTWGLGSENLSYPANVYVFKYKGAKTQKDFNLNGLIALRTLNELNGGPVFPSDYKFNKFKTVNLKRTLEFYRGWIDTSWVRPGDSEPFYNKLKNNDGLWDTYCAEHLTIVMNVALNVEHNEEGFQNIWGEVEGKKLWEKLQSRWSSDLSTSLESVDTSFDALWELENLKNPAEVSKVGKAMAWGPQTTADLVGNFVNQYVPFYRVGSLNTAAVIYGFMKETYKRMGMANERFVQLVTPIIAQMFVYESIFHMTASADNKLSDSEAKALYAGRMTILEKTLESLASQSDSFAALKPGISAAINVAKNGPFAKLAKIEVNKNLQVPLHRLGVVFNDKFLSSVKGYFKAADQEHVEMDDGNYRVKYYSPPAVLRRIALGIHGKNRALTVIPVATAVNPWDVEPKVAAEQVQPEPVVDVVGPQAQPEPVAEEEVIAEVVEQAGEEIVEQVQEALEEEIGEQLQNTPNVNKRRRNNRLNRR
ncbi:MAG: hypothetical protein ACPGJV_16275, partial [Bacteriovoracaceae bacterium]